MKAMRVYIGFPQAVGVTIAVFLFSLASFSQDTQSYTSEAGGSTSFLSRPNVAVAPADRGGNHIWEDSVYNEAVVLYKKGQYVKAVSVYKKACEGFAKACTNLGFMYLKGQGTEINHSLAAEYFKRGCERGNALGCTNLGIMYWVNSPPNNDKRAVDLFEQGCRNGDSDGCRDLGYMYKHGYAVLKDEAHAAELYRQADQLSHIHRIPFHMQDGLILVSLNIQDETAILIIDTGSVRTALNRKFLPAGLSLQPSATVSTMLGSGQAYEVNVNWKLDGRDIQLPVLLGDFNFPQGAVGLLGTDILGTFSSVRFDYANKVLILED